MLFRSDDVEECFITSYEGGEVDVSKEIKGTFSAMGIRINDWCAHVADGDFEYEYYAYSFLEKK